jgi:hypothetical protein
MMAAEQPVACDSALKSACFDRAWPRPLRWSGGGGMAAATVAATVQLVRHNAEGSVMTFTE